MGLCILLLSEVQKGEWEYCSCLQRLTEKRQHFTRTEECESLQGAASSPVLSYPNNTDPFILNILIKWKMGGYRPESVQVLNKEGTLGSCVCSEAFSSLLVQEISWKMLAKWPHGLKSSALTLRVIIQLEWAMEMQIYVLSRILPVVRVLLLARTEKYHRHASHKSHVPVSRYSRLADNIHMRFSSGCSFCNMGMRSTDKRLMEITVDLYVFKLFQVAIEVHFHNFTIN